MGNNATAAAASAATTDISEAHIDRESAFADLRQIVEPIDRDLYCEFETEAKERLRGRDENDWPVLATALGLTCPIWTEDADFFGTGIAV